MESSSKFGLNDDFVIHVEILEEFFFLKDIKDEQKKKSNLLTSLSMDVYVLLRNLLSPKLPKDVAYSELVSVLKKQFARQSIRYKERQKFYSASQTAGESIKEYYNKIKGLAVNCEFGSQLDEILKDKFICGLLKGSIFDKMCDIACDSDLNKCVESAMQKELIIEEASCHKVVKNSIKDKNVLKNKNGQNGTSGKSSSGEQNQKNRKNGNEDMKCNACGKPNHNFKRCKFRKYNCRSCGAVGHLQAVCRKLKYMEYENNSASETSFSLFSLSLEDKYFSNKLKINESVCSNISNFSRSCSDDFVVNLEVEGILLKFEIDTGSAVSTMSEALFVKHFKKHMLKPFNMFLKAYNGAPIKVEGCFAANVKYNSKMVSVNFVVIKTNCDPLIGRDTLRKLGCSIKLHNIDISEDVKLIVSKYPALFDRKLGAYNHELIRLELKENTNPIFIGPRKVPFAYRKSLEDELSRLENAGVISKCGVNAWGTPLVTVVKKCGKLRVCADYSRTVNNHLKEYNYALPKIDDIFQSLQGGQLFSKLDLSEAYHQLKLDDETSKILAWSTHLGVYKVNRLPFGCKPNSSIFQAVMEKVLVGCKGTVVFIDDIVVTGINRSDHLVNLRCVLDRLERSGFTINKDKCSFFQKKIFYLGYIIDADGLHKDPEKIRAICEMPEPKDKTQAKAFCGLVNYYGRFLPNLSCILKPLYDSFGDGDFRWTKECSNAMKKVKNLVTADNVLVHYDETKPIVLTCDASDYGIGACLSQIMPMNEEHPIAFASRTLNKTERNYSVIDKEACAIYFGVKKFEQYLVGRRFQIRTDHKPLTAIFGNKKGIPTTSANRLTRWAIYLSSFDFETVYIKGSTNSCADTLSRLTNIVDSADETDDSVLKFIDNHFKRPIRFDDVASQSKIDPVLSKAIEYVQREWPKVDSLDKELTKFFNRRDELSLDRGVLMLGSRVVIPKKFRATLLSEVHSCHTGIVRAKELVRSFFWWPGVDKELEDLIKSCEICRVNRNNPPSGEPSPWQTTTSPFERIHIDFCEVNHYYFLVVVDAYSKWVEVAKLKSMTSKVTIECLETIFSIFGLPKIIVSDNGTSFSSVEFRLFCSSNGIKHFKSPPYHPPSNGQAENSVRNFKMSFIKMIDGKYDDIDKRVKQLLYMHRNTINSVTKKTPYEMMFSRKPVLRWEQLKPQTEIKINFKNKMTVGQYVYAKDFRNKKYILGRIVKIVGNKIYEIRVENGLLWTRHENHLTPATVAEKNNENNKCDESQKSQKLSLTDVLKERVSIPIGVGFNNESHNNPKTYIDQRALNGPNAFIDHVPDRGGNEIAIETAINSDEGGVETAQSAITIDDDNIAAAPLSQSTSILPDSRPKREIRKPKKLDL